MDHQEITSAMVKRTPQNMPRRMCRNQNLCRILRTSAGRLRHDSWIFRVDTSRHGRLMMKMTQLRWDKRSSLISLTVVLHPNLHAHHLGLFRDILLIVSFGPSVKQLRMRATFFLWFFWHGRDSSSISLSASAEASRGSHTAQKGNIENCLAKKHHDGRSRVQTREIKWR